MKKYDGILKKVRMVEEKYGIKYAKTDGRLYKTLNFIYTLLFVWTLIINLLFIIGNMFIYSETEYMSSISNSIITVLVSSLMIVLGYIFNNRKIHLIGGILNLIFIILLIPTFAPLMTDTAGLWGLKYSFYWRHFVPLLLMFIVIIWMTVIAERARILTNKQYKKVVENLFVMNNNMDCNASKITDEEWDEFLKNYDPKNQKPNLKKKVDGEESE